MYFCIISGSSQVPPSPADSQVRGHPSQQQQQQQRTPEDVEFVLRQIIIYLQVIKVSYSIVMTWPPTACHCPKISAGAPQVI